MAEVAKVVGENRKRNKVHIIRRERTENIACSCQLDLAISVVRTLHFYLSQSNCLSKYSPLSNICFEFNLDFQGFPETPYPLPKQKPTCPMFMSSFKQTTYLLAFKRLGFYEPGSKG